jgi:hypothetical protein
MLLLLQRSQRHVAGSLLALLVLVLLQLQAFTASAAASATWVRRGGSAAGASLQTSSSPVLGPATGRTRRQRRWLYLVGVPTHEGTGEATGGSGRPTNGNNVVASPYHGAGGAGGAGKALASETASMAAGTAAAASTSTTESKPKAADTGKPAGNATSPTTDSGNETATTTSTSSTARKSKPSAASTNSSQDAIDDASGAQDDDTTGASPAHYSQWDVTNATDFDAMLKNQTYRGPGLLPPDDADPPPHWDVAMAAFFGGLAVLLCLGTAVRRYRNQQRQRASYEPIHNLTV